jgi:hypothetical protein
LSVWSQQNQTERQTDRNRGEANHDEAPKKSEPWPQIRLGLNPK